MGTSTTSYLGVVYGVSIFLASAAGMGAAFLGNRIFPLKGGDYKPPPTPAEVAAAVKNAERADSEASKLADQLASSGIPLPKPEPEQEKEESQPEVQPEEEKKEEEEQPEEEKKEEEDSLPEPELEKEEVESLPEPEVQPEPKKDNKLYITKIKEKLGVSDEVAEDIFTIINTPTALVNTIPDITTKFKAIKDSLIEKHEDVAKLVASKILSFQTPGEIGDDVFVKDLHELVPPS